MRSFTIVRTTALAVLALRLQCAASGEEQDKSNTKISGVSASIDCLTAFNEARAAAKLDPFEDGTADLGNTITNATITQEICDEVASQLKVKSNKEFSVTPAFAIQNGTTGDCSAAVTYFNGALSLFGNLPPAYDDDIPVYQNLHAVSFIALYNPQKNAKLACAYYTCNATTTVSSKSGVEASGSGSTTTEIVGRALACATEPQAMIDGKLPFTEKQFEKIKKAINSASSALPTVGVLAAAALGLLLF